MVIRAHRIHRAVHEVHLGRDLNKKDCLVWIRAQDRCDQHRPERIQMYPHIVFDRAQWIAIHRMIRKQTKGAFLLYPSDLKAFDRWYVLALLNESFYLLLFFKKSDNVIETVEHQTTKVSYRVVLDVHIIHIENVAIVHVIDAPNLVQRMKAVDVVFRDIENQPVRWNYLTRINNGVTVNVDEMTTGMARASKVKMITMAVIKGVVIGRIGIFYSSEAVKWSIEIISNILVTEMK